LPDESVTTAVNCTVVPEAAVASVGVTTMATRSGAVVSWHAASAARMLAKGSAVRRRWRETAVMINQVPGRASDESLGGFADGLSSPRPLLHYGVKAANATPGCVGP
jgi:hypothetical protein